MIINDLSDKMSELQESINSLSETGKAYATAERNYKILLSQESLKLRDQGMPVTLIEKVVLGLPNVAQARWARDVAETVYKANSEAINAIKLNIRVLQDQANMEWSGAKYEQG